MRELTIKGADVEGDAASEQAGRQRTAGAKASLRLPLLLAVAAVVLMLPALPTGLALDDLGQRAIQFKPADLPPEVLDTGFVSSDSGKLGTVLNDLFGFARGEERIARAEDYGVLSWYMAPGLRAALWRPLTALTHWLDYRLFPDTPALMHAHNIAWFAVVVFLVTLLYRRIGASFGAAPAPPGAPASSENHKRRSAAVVAGLAAGLFVLDRNTYFPVAYVANRGFIISLVFGVLCLLAHDLWRRRRDSFGPMIGSALCLLLSLLANEGGASTLAFLGAYMLVLDRGTWRQRLASLVPAAVVMVVWRIVYVSSGFGVRQIGGYIDPGYEPLLFLSNLAPRLNLLLGGQLTGLPPELSFALHPKWKHVLAGLFAAFSLLSAVAFLPVLLKDRVARFWATAMLLALVPAATVVPLSKNMAFVAVGAFGLIASFLWRFTAREARVALARPVWVLTWFVAVWLIVAHTLGALTGRVILAAGGRFVAAASARWCGFLDFPEFGAREVVVVNNVGVLSTLAAPFYRAYHHLPVPKSINSLVPGGGALEVSRTDPFTLVLKAKDSDLFKSDCTEPVHIAHVLNGATEFLAGVKRWEAGERIRRKHLVVNVLSVTKERRPSSISVRFTEPLESGRFLWIFFDWRTGKFSRFVPPPIGSSVEIDGASVARRLR